jgi:hypothetical protein
MKKIMQPLTSEICKIHLICFTMEVHAFHLKPQDFVTRFVTLTLE